MILILDNYDSFVHNVARYVHEAGHSHVQVVRNDRITAEEVLERSPSHLILSPGPCTPDRAGISLELVRKMAGHLPILGICLGHQVVGQAFGGRIGPAPAPLHGIARPVRHTGTGILAGLPSPFQAARYHSLVVDADSIPGELQVVAWDDEGTVMALQHRSFPIWGVQFHPESILTPEGHGIIRNFLAQSSVATVAGTPARPHGEGC